MELQQHFVRFDQFYCEPSYPVLEGNNLFIGLNKTRSGMHVNGDSDAEFAAIDVSSQQILWTYRFDTSARKPMKGTPVNGVIAAPVIWQDKIIIASNYELACLSRTDGQKIWSLTFKEMADINLSVVGGQLFYSNGNAVHLADIETGKSLVKRKYKVKWIDSPLVSHQSRIFISTASSKILELSPQSLEVVNEFPYSGNWAIAETPFFHEDFMISSSYAGEIVAFNLSSNQPEWKVAKKAGSLPLQAAYKGSALFYDGHTDSRLRRIEIKGKKTAWTKDLENVQALKILDGDEFLAVYRSGEDTFNLSLFNFHDGGLKQQITDETPAWKDYPYGLWQGISIENTERHIVANFKPNEIAIFEKTVPDLPR